MEKKSRRKAAEVAPRYLFSSDEDETNNDDSLFVLEDSTEFNSDHESKPKKRKVNPQKSKDRTDAPTVKKAICRPSKKKSPVEFASSHNTDEIACDSGIREPVGSSSSLTNIKKTKRRGKQDSSERLQHKRIKLETSEIIPDLSKVKAERVSLTELPFVNRIKSEKSDEYDQSQNDVKPNLNHLKAENDSESSDESDDVDLKPNLQKIKLEKCIKEDPDMASKKSKTKSTLKTKVKNEVKQEADPSEPNVKKNMKVKKEVKQEAGSSQPSLKKPKVKSEVKHEANPGFLDGDFESAGAFSHRLSVNFLFIFIEINL